VITEINSLNNRINYNPNRTYGQLTPAKDNSRAKQEDTARTATEQGYIQSYTVHIDDNKNLKILESNESQESTIKPARIALDSTLVVQFLPFVAIQGVGSNSVGGVRTPYGNVIHISAATVKDSSSAESYVIQGDSGNIIYVSPSSQDNRISVDPLRTQLESNFLSNKGNPKLLIASLINSARGIGIQVPDKLLSKQETLELIDKMMKKIDKLTGSNSSKDEATKVLNLISELI